MRAYAFPSDLILMLRALLTKHYHRAARYSKLHDKSSAALICELFILETLEVK